MGPVYYESWKLPDPDLTVVGTILGIKKDGTTVCKPFVVFGGVLLSINILFIIRNTLCQCLLTHY